MIVCATVAFMGRGIGIRGLNNFGIRRAAVCAPQDRPRHRFKPGMVGTVSPQTSRTSIEASRYLPASLTTLHMANTPYDVPTIPAATINIEVTDCGWSDTQVNNLLAQLVTNAAHNGTVLCAGSNAAPSPTGSADRDTLVSRGWSVATN